MELLGCAAEKCILWCFWDLHLVAQSWCFEASLLYVKRL